LPQVVFVVLFVFTGAASGQIDARRLSVCVLDFGAAGEGRRASARLADELTADAALKINDLDESRAAAKGAGYAGATNLSLDEARDLGGALGCDFYALGKVETVDRSSLARPKFFESYAALVWVSGNTGRLVLWDAVSAGDVTPERAAAALPEALAERAKVYADKLRQARAQEQMEEKQRLTLNAPLVLDADAPEAQGLRLPAPYRRLQPAYPATAAAVNAAGTVDVLATIDTEGRVQKTEISRWAGFGLDEAAADTVRQMNFRPAMRDGVAIPLRVLLRYNFRPK
jgi:TonB family protein